MRQVNKKSKDFLLDKASYIYTSKNFTNIDVLIERVTYLLSREKSYSDITIKRLKDLRQEINKVLVE